MKDTRDVIGLNVFSVEEGRVLGRTVECVVDLAAGDVLGLIVQVKGGGEMGIARGDITAVGKDAVMVGSDAVMKPLVELEVLADHRTSGPAAPKVITRDGTVLGGLGTVRVDEKCETVEGYEIVVDVVAAIADGPASLPIVEGTVHGRDAIVLPSDADTAVNRPGGLRQRIEKAYDTVVDGASGVGQKVGTVAKKGWEAAEDTVKDVTGVVEKTYAKATKKAKPVAAKKAKAAPIVEPEPAPAKKAPAKAKKAPAKKKAAAKKKAPAKKKKKAASKKRAAKKAPTKGE